jgi:hypothetical protein
MARKRTTVRPTIERDPNPFMRVSGPFSDDAPVGEKRYLDLADIALGNKISEPPRYKKPKQPNSS